MKPEIKKIRVDELESFVSSETFKRLSIVPITTLRARSYAANPLAQPGDIVLYLGFIDNQLVAFRSIFAGVINAGNSKIRFGWCSGAWVHPDLRRQGFSMLLLNEALADWNGKLMLTNYSPQTEKLFLKSGKFKVIHRFQGFRGYLFPKILILSSCPTPSGSNSQRKRAERMFRKGK